MEKREVNNLTCEILEENLSNLLEGHVTPTLRDELNLHLSECGTCRELKEAVAATVMECRSLSDGIVMSADLEGRLIRVAIPDWKIECATFEEHLTELIDDVIGSNLNRGLRIHLSECKACAELHSLATRGVAAMKDSIDDSLPVSYSLRERLSEIPESGTVSGFMRPVRARMRKFAEIVESVFSSPIIGQSTVAAMLLVTAFVFFGVRTEAEERDAPVIAKGYEMVMKTYREGSDVVKNAVSFPNDESNGGGER